MTPQRQSEAIPDFSSLHTVEFDEHCTGPSPRKDAAMGHYMYQEGREASRTRNCSIKLRGKV